MEQIQYFVSCAVIVDSKGNVLLTKRYSPHNYEVHDKWQLPGGSVDLHEHPKTSAIREVREETGLEVEIVSDRPHIFSNSFNNGVHVLLVIYKAAYKGGVVDISADLEETSDAQWFAVHEIENLELLPRTQEIIETVLSTEK